jgi:protein TonB
MFNFLVESAADPAAVSRLVFSRALALMLQSLGLAALAAAPLFYSPRLPAPGRLITRFAREAPARQAPAGGVATGSAHRASRSLPRAGALWLVPSVIPDSIPPREPEGEPGIGSSEAVPGGVPLPPIETPIEMASPASAPVRPGGDVRPPRRIGYLPPVYPELARQGRVEGVVVLETIIDAEGNVTQVRVLRSIPLLDRAAVEAVRQWKYEPTLLNGLPVPVVMTVTVRFELTEK